MIITSTISLVGLAMLLGLVFWLYNDYRVDRLRHELFEIRDSLFQAAADGRIAFDSHAYRITRSMLNGFIRFGHRVSLSGVITTLALARRGGTRSARRLIEQAQSSSPAEDRALCASTMELAHRAIIRHIASSPLMWLLVLPVVLALLGVVSSAKVARALRGPLRELDASALGEACG